MDTSQIRQVLQQFILQFQQELSIFDLMAKVCENSLLVLFKRLRHGKDILTQTLEFIAIRISSYYVLLKRRVAFQNKLHVLAHHSNVWFLQSRTRPRPTRAMNDAIWPEFA